MLDVRWIGRVPLRLVTTKAEYVAADSCCAHLLWMRQTLKDYGYTMNQVPLLYNNKSVIKITYNSCEHSRTKYIDIRHHFLRDHAIKGDIVISHVRSNEQLSDIFTKPLDERRFGELRSELNIIDSWHVGLKVAHLKCYLLVSILSLFYVENPLMLLVESFEAIGSCKIYKFLHANDCQN
jgi:hypothetical protein